MNNFYIFLINTLTIHVHPDSGKSNHLSQQKEDSCSTCSRSSPPRKEKVNPIHKLGIIVTTIAIILELTSIKSHVNANNNIQVDIVAYKKMKLKYYEVLKQTKSLPDAMVQLTALGFTFVEKNVSYKNGNKKSTTYYFHKMELDYYTVIVLNTKHYNHVFDYEVFINKIEQKEY